MAIHKSVNYCVKQFKHDQDNEEDIGAKFLLCCLDFEFSSLDKKLNSLIVKYVHCHTECEYGRKGTIREILWRTKGYPADFPCLFSVLPYLAFQCSNIFFQKKNKV